MFRQSPTNESKSPEPPLMHPGALPDSEGAKEPPLPEPPYRPYAEKPALSEQPYKPYDEKPAWDEIPYEPYKGI